jgi:5-methyltetrahydrofolate--homocysteine methyltransferase
VGKLLDKLNQVSVLIGDGAWGTFLYEKGLMAGDCPEYWNLSMPGEVKDIALSYVNAGSDIIETNSFGANSIKLNHFNLAPLAFKINYEAARISRIAAGETRIVLGSMGPTGKLLIMGDISKEQLYNSFSEQANALEQGGADALIIETMSDIEEARIAVKAARDHTKCDIVVSFTYSRAGDEYRTMMGISPEDVMKEFAANPNAIIGSNCGNGIRNMIPIALAMSHVNSESILMIQANAGQPVYKDGKTIFPESPEEMVGHLSGLINAGVRIIGGCCGTTPNHIKAFRNYIDHNIQ